MMHNKQLVLPGQLIVLPTDAPSAEKVVLGPGVARKPNGELSATIAGEAVFDSDNGTISVSDLAATSSLRAASLGSFAQSCGTGRIPTDSMVLLRVERVSDQTAVGEIIARLDNDARCWCCPFASLFLATFDVGRNGAYPLCGSKPFTPVPLRGVLRAEAVRPATIRGRGHATEAVVELKDSFRPGDVVAAAVVGVLGDVRQYQLTTTPPSCGVVQARSRAGGQLVATFSGDRTRMTCTITGRVESRWIPAEPYSY